MPLPSGVMPSSSKSTPDSRRPGLYAYGCPDLSDLLDDELPLISLMQWLEEEFGGKVIAVMPSLATVEPGGETYWVVFEHDTQRTIQWVVGLKTISEGA